MAWSNFLGITFTGHTAGPIKNTDRDGVDGSVVTFGKGTTCCSLSMAVNSQAFGEEESYGKWLNIKFFGQVAENVIYNFGEDGVLNHPGVPLVIHGKPFIRPYRGRVRDATFDYDGEEEFDDDVFAMQESLDVNAEFIGLDISMMEINELDYNKVKREYQGRDGDDDDGGRGGRKSKSKSKSRGSRASGRSSDDGDDGDSGEEKSSGRSSGRSGGRSSGGRSSGGRSSGRSSGGGRSSGSGRTRSGGRSSGGRSSNRRSRPSSDDE